MGVDTWCDPNCSGDVCFSGSCYICKRTEEINSISITLLDQARLTIIFLFIITDVAVGQQLRRH